MSIGTNFPILYCIPCFLFLAWLPLQAQGADRLFHYAIEDLTTGQVIARGTMGENGIPANQILGAESRYRQWLYEHETGLLGVADFTSPAS